MNITANEQISLDLYMMHCLLQSLGETNIKEGELSPPAEKEREKDILLVIFY